MTSKRAKRALPYLLAFFLALMILSSYSNTFTSPPYLDDFHSFVYAKSMYLKSVSLSSILALSRSEFGLTRFLPVVTLALNHALGKSELVYFHAVNILIHILAFFAFFWLVRQILSVEKKRRPEGVSFDLAGYFPLCVAALWALNPVQTNAVTYLVQRMASMQTLFFTLSVGCFIKARLLSYRPFLTEGFERAGRKKAVLFYGLCAIAALCAFLSKENSAMLPIMLAFTDIWFFDSAWLKKLWAIFRRTGWKVRILLAAAVMSTSYYALAVVLPKILQGYLGRDFTLAERLLTEGRVVVWYMSLLLWPDPSRLSVEHDFSISTSFLDPISTLPAILLIAGLVILAVKFRKRFPVITYGVVWFFLNLAIESTFIPLELVFEHRLYLPSMGFFLSVGALILILFRQAASRIPEKDFVKASCSVFLVFASLLTLLTFVRNEAWEDMLTIQYDAVIKSPNNPRTYASLANVLCKESRFEDALQYGEKSLEIGHKGRETTGLAQNAVILALVHLGRVDEAISRAEAFLADIQKLRVIDGDAVPNLCLNVSQAYMKKENPLGAYRWMFEALKFIQTSDNSKHKKELVRTVAFEFFEKFGPQGAELNGDGATDTADLSPQVWVAMEFEKHGEHSFARQILEEECAKDPNEPHLAAFIEKFKKEDAQNRAQEEKWQSLQKYVQNPLSRYNFDMAVAYLVQERHLPKFFRDLGEKRLDAALEISPGSSEARLLKGWYCYDRDDAVHAVEEVRTVLGRDPENSNAWLALGFFLAKTGDADGAVAAFEKVTELYPGYLRRSIVEDLCRQLKDGKAIKSASNRE